MRVYNVDEIDHSPPSAAAIEVRRNGRNRYEIYAHSPIPIDGSYEVERVTIL